MSGETYSILTDADVAEMTQLLAEVFSQHDPPAVAVGLTSEEFHAFVSLLCEKAVEQGLTIVARSSSGEMMGALLTEDSATPQPEGIDRLSPKLNPIFEILGGLDAEYREGREMPPGASLHLFLLGVARQFGGRGAAHRLIEECLANGGRKGYRRAVTEATNRRSQHVFRKLGFVERVRRSYADFEYEGSRPFASIAVEGGPSLMDIELTSTDLPHSSESEGSSSIA